VLSTVLSFGERKNIPLVSDNISAESALEFVNRKYRFTKIRIAPETTVREEWMRKQVEGVIREAHEKCLIANLMRTKVKIEPGIVLF
jgi:OsmC-like protein.